MGGGGGGSLALQVAGRRRKRSTNGGSVSVVRQQLGRFPPSSALLFLRLPATSFLEVADLRRLSAWTLLILYNSVGRRGKF